MRKKMTFDTIDDGLEAVQVQEVEFNHEHNLTGWYVVTDEQGVRAYFEDATDACRFRIDVVNRTLNP